MAKKFLTAIDLNKCELQNAVIQNLASAPSSPGTGQIYFNSTAGDKSIYFYDGTSWVDVGGDLRSIVAGNAISVSGTRDITVNVLYDDSSIGKNGSNQLYIKAGGVTNAMLVNSAITVTAGAGLTGGGSISLGSSTTLDIGAGTGITVNANDVALDTASTRNTDHSAVVLTAGAGLTGGGDITASRTFDIGGGAGITVGANDIAVTGAAGLTPNTLSKWDGTGFANSTITDDGTTVTIGGNLTVTGVTTTVNSNTVNIGDNIIVLNSDETGTPSQDAGIEVERGTSTNVTLLWDETNDRWTVGAYNFVAANFVGDLIGNAATATNAATADKWTIARTITLGGDLTGNVSIDGSANVTLTATIAANSVALGTDTTGNYVATIAATAGTGISVSGSGSETAAVTIAGIDATTSVKGVVELATSAEANLLTDTVRAVTPAALAGLRHAETGPPAPATSYIVNHNLNSLDVIVQVYEVASGNTVECDVTRTNPTSVTLGFTFPQTANSLRVLVMKVA